MADIGFLPPGLRGYLAGEQINQQREAQGLHSLVTATTLQQHLEAQRQKDQITRVLASDMPPEQKQAELLKLPGGADIIRKMVQMQQHAAQTKNLESQAPLHQAQTFDLLRKMQEGQTQSAARTELASLLTPEGYMAQPGAGRVDVVTPNAGQALELVKSAEAAGQPLTAGSPNPATLQSLAIKAKMGGREMTALGIGQPKEDTGYSRELDDLIKKRDALIAANPNNPTIKIIDNAIKFKTEHAPPIQVNMPAVHTETFRMDKTDGKLHKYVTRIGKDGTVEEVDAGISEAAPKEVDPVKKAIADMINKGGKSTIMSSTRPVISPLGSAQNPHKPQTDSDFADMASGSIYIDPGDGKTYRKK